MLQITGQKNQDGLYIWHNHKPRMSFEDRLMNLMLEETTKEEQEEDEEEEEYDL